VTALPIDPFVPQIIETVGRSRAVVVTAAPGAGKTTRVPPALVADGPVILLQPRRVAARSIARRIADERGWTVGREIGWQVRFERRFCRETRLLVATEGILTARLQQDPLLSTFATVVLDEFHERSLHVDLAIALVKQACLARSDLRIVVMSATLEAAAVSHYLHGCPTIEVPGRQHPLDIEYAPAESITSAAIDLLSRRRGDILCFLPGAFEIRRAVGDLRPAVERDVDVVPLHGTLDAAGQDAALAPAAPGRRKVVVATNIAETSVTVPGVTAVVDSGLHKVARYDVGRGIDSLVTERIPLDAADQRAGRAARLGPGIVRRLWDARDRLHPHREAEIHRVDLASLVLDVLAWGGDPRTLDWFDRPRAEALDGAFRLLDRLGATTSGTLTDLGREMQRLPIHPRLARMLIAAVGARAIARACAVLSERQFVATGASATTSDLLSAVDRWQSVPPHLERVAREVEQLAGAGGLTARSGDSDSDSRLSETEFRRAVLAGYPDRVAQRRDPASPRVKLASGAGGIIGSMSGVRVGEFIVAIDVQAPQRPGDPDSLIRVASLVEREWLEPNAIEIEHRFDAEDGTLRAVEVVRYDALTLGERPVPLDPERAATLLSDRWLERGPRGEDRNILARLAFTGHSIDLPALVRAAAYGKRSLDAVVVAQALPADILRRLDRDAPETVRVPSGRAVPIEYRDDGTVAASVKLQELFGLADTPRIGPHQAPLLIALLAPNGRPVQMTRDLRSFWEKTYPEVRKELRGRYPKHPWPEDPWTAAPTARTVRKPR
jgi:ATP-dependent helicase HrpB